MTYIGPILALITGVLGILYSKAGERQKLHRVAYWLLALVALSGLVTLYGIHSAQAEAEAKRVTAEREKAAAEQGEREKAQDLLAERRKGAVFRSNAVASAFAPQDVPAEANQVIFLLDLPSIPLDDKGEGGSPPLWPLLAPEVRSTHFVLEVDGVLELDYRLTAQGEGARIDADWYEYDQKACVLLSGNRYEFTPAPGSPCTRADKYLFNALYEAGPVGNDWIVYPPKTPFWKLYSRAEQTSDFNGGIGWIEIELADSRDLPKFYFLASQIEPMLKFFQPYPHSSEEDPCNTTLLAMFGTIVRPTGPRTIRVEILGIRDTQLNLCEIPRNS